MYRSLLLVLIVASLLTIGCNKAPTPPAVQEPVYYTHTIKNQGETLGVISKWYTGSSANWQAIQKANPGLQVNRLRLGQTINIPDNLVVKREPLSKEFVAQLVPSATTQAEQAITQANNQALAAASGTEQVAANEPREMASLMPEQLSNQDNPVANEPPLQEAPGGHEESPNQKLFSAVVFADVPQIKALIAAGADPNYRENDRHLLAWASQNQSVDAVKALLESGAQVNPVDGIGHTALMRAADTSQVEIAKVLLQAKADPNIKAPNGSTALTMAISNGNVDMVKVLLDAGADPNIVLPEGDSAALIAAQNNATDILKLLAASKANLNLANIIYTPLTYAISQDNLTLMKTLLDLGADPNVSAQSQSAPIFQTIHSPEMTKLLIDAKVNVNVKDSSYGQTPLMNAIQNSYAKTVEILIAGGADVNIRDNSDNTALKIAQNNMNTEIADLLKKSGATE